MHRNADFSNHVKQKQIASNNREVRKTITLKTPPLLTSDPYLRIVYTFYKLEECFNDDKFHRLRRQTLFVVGVLINSFKLVNLFKFCNLASLFSTPLMLVGNCYLF